MTKLPLLRAAIAACLFVSSWAAVASCDREDALMMYSNVTNHADELKRDAEDNPSKIPFQKGKNDPRVKKSIKITKRAGEINEQSIANYKYAKACKDLRALAKQYKIDVGDQTGAITLEKGAKGAMQAKAMKDKFDRSKNARKEKKKSRFGALSNGISGGLN